MTVRLSASTFNQQTALIYDGGLYPFMATTLAQRFGRVLFFTPVNADAFPVFRKAYWGDGLPNVERTNDFFAHVDEADVIVFPDVGMGDLQAYLRAHGKAVWGSGEAEVLELDRAALKRWQTAQKLPTPDHTILAGMAALRAHLEDPANENQFVKISEYRGDAETYHHVNWWLSAPWLDAMDHQFGRMRERLTFVAEAAIPDAIEVGYDGYTVDGAFPSLSVIGYENKDTAYIGQVILAKQLPAVLQQVNDAAAPFFKATQCRSMFSSEVRVTEDGIGYLIDPCLRNGSPPSEALTELFSNWPEIIAAGAHGVLVEPEPVAQFCAQVVLRSAWADDGFLALRFPEDVRHLVKLHGHAIVDETDYVVALGMDIIGSAVGLGDTIEEATAQALEVAASIEGQQLMHDAHGFEPIYQAIEDGVKRGIPWT